MRTKLTLLVFILCFSVGTFLSVHKKLWNDELYTQIGVVERVSYQRIMTSRFTEGNVAPLFYIIQKGFMDIIHFRTPEDWADAWVYEDLKAQVAMRIIPNLFMSLSLSMIFGWFFKRYGWHGGFYALAVSLTTYMVWVYWTEARPYSLWFFLTTWQTLAFLDGNKKQVAITNIFLSITIIFGAIQSAIVSLFMKDRRLILMSALTLLLGIYYYHQSSHMTFFLNNSIGDLFFSSIPKERVVLIVLLGALARMKTFYSYYVITSLFALSLLLVFCLKDTGQGFPVSNRYFLFLASIGIIATSLFTLEVFKKYELPALLEIAWVLVIMRAIRIYILALGYFTTGG